MVLGRHGEAETGIFLGSQTLVFIESLRFACRKRAEPDVRSCSGRARGWERWLASPPSSLAHCRARSLLGLCPPAGCGYRQLHRSAMWRNADLDGLSRRESVLEG